MATKLSRVSVFSSEHERGNLPISEIAPAIINPGSPNFPPQGVGDPFRRVDPAGIVRDYADLARQEGLPIHQGCLWKIELTAQQCGAA